LRPGDAFARVLIPGSRFQHGALGARLDFDRISKKLPRGVDGAPPRYSDEFLKFAARVVADPGWDEDTFDAVPFVEFEHGAAIRAGLQIPVPGAPDTTTFRALVPAKASHDW
jgi:hypothetical protein